MTKRCSKDLEPDLEETNQKLIIDEKTNPEQVAKHKKTKNSVILFMKIFIIL